MRFDKLEYVVLAHDVPEHDLWAGDLGAVVEIYPEGDVEVEFVRDSRVTQALLTLSEQDVRRIDSRDLLTTQRLAKVA